MTGACRVEAPVMAYRNVAYRKSGMDEAKIAQLYKKGRGQMDNFF